MKTISDEKVRGLPFYKDKWYTEEGFPMLENLIIMMHFSQIGIKDEDGLSWIKQKILKEGLFGRYTVEGEALNSVESPVIYAIVVQIVKNYHDKELYKLAMNKLKDMQNLSDNQYYGGFIDINNLSSFSFDNLLALLAYTK